MRLRMGIRLYKNHRTYETRRGGLMCRFWLTQDKQLYKAMTFSTTIISLLRQLDGEEIYITNLSLSKDAPHPEEPAGTPWEVVIVVRDIELINETNNFELNTQPLTTNAELDKEFNPDDYTTTTDEDFTLDLPANGAKAQEMFSDEEMEEMFGKDE